RTVLRRSGGAASARTAPLRFGEIELDGASRVVTSAGAPVALTTKEFDLLWFLASHPRQVFSRDQLMDRVWDYAAAVDTGTVTVAAASASAAVLASLVLARSITRSIRRVGASAQRLATGDLAARAPGGGAAEIARLAASFNAMAASLEQLFDARRELVAWASHDLRAPIASLQAMLEAIEDGLVSAEDYLPTLRAQVRTLSTLVDDLFELARIDAGVLTLELRQVPVAPLVASALQLLQPEAEAP